MGTDPDGGENPARFTMYSWSKTFFPVPVDLNIRAGLGEASYRIQPHSPTTTFSRSFSIVAGPMPLMRSRSSIVS